MRLFWFSLPHDSIPLRTRQVRSGTFLFLDAIKALKSEDVRICFQAEMKPFVVLSPKDDTVIELITPMRTY